MLSLKNGAVAARCWMLLLVALFAVHPAIAADDSEPLPPVTRAVKKVAPPVVPKFADLQYGDGTNAANLLDIYLPEKVNKPAPVVVWIHGGGWASNMNDKSNGICRR